MSKKNHKKKARLATGRAVSSPKSRQIGRKDQEIARLRRELGASRRENARLTREISDLRREVQASRLGGEEQPFRRLRRGRGERKQERLLDESGRRARHFRKKSFLRYLWEAVMESAPVLVLTKLLQYFRRVRVVQIILSLLVTVGAVAAVALLSATVLPFLLAAAALLSILAYLRSRRTNRILARELTGKRIRVLVAPGRRALAEGSFFVRNAYAMAAEDGVSVLVVSPYLLSRRGLGGKGHYFTARKEGEGVFLIRKPYFFLLRRSVLDAGAEDVTVVY